MDSERNSTLTRFKNSSSDLLKTLYETSIPTEMAPPASFWKPYTDEKLAIGLCACLVMWEASGKKIVPNEFQITTTIALMSGQDAMVDVGTGYGKTLCMIIPCLFFRGALWAAASISAKDLGTDATPMRDHLAGHVISVQGRSEFVNLLRMWQCILNGLPI